MRRGFEIRLSLAKKTSEHLDNATRSELRVWFLLFGGKMSAFVATRGTVTLANSGFRSKATVNTSRCFLLSAAGCTACDRIVYWAITFQRMY